MTNVTATSEASSPQRASSRSNDSQPSQAGKIPYEQVMEEVSTLAEWEFRRQGEDGFRGLSLGPAAVSLEKGMGGGFTLTWTSDLPGLQSGFSRFSSLEEARSRYRELQSELRSGIVERAEDQVASLNLGLSGGADADGVSGAITEAIAKADREAIQLESSSGASDGNETSEAREGTTADRTRASDRSTNVAGGGGRPDGNQHLAAAATESDRTGSSDTLVQELRDELTMNRLSGEGIERVEWLLERLRLPDAAEVEPS